MSTPSLVGLTHSGYFKKESQDSGQLVPYPVAYNALRLPASKEQLEQAMTVKAKRLGSPELDVDKDGEQPQHSLLSLFINDVFNAPDGLDDLVKQAHLIHTLWAVKTEMKIAAASLSKEERGSQVAGSMEVSIKHEDRAQLDFDLYFRGPEKRAKGLVDTIAAGKFAGQAELATQNIQVRASVLTGSDVKRRKVRGKDDGTDSKTVYGSPREFKVARIEVDCGEMFNQYRLKSVQSTGTTDSNLAALMSGLGTESAKDLSQRISDLNLPNSELSFRREIAGEVYSNRERIDSFIDSLDPTNDQVLRRIADDFRKAINVNTVDDLSGTSTKGLEALF